MKFCSIRPETLSVEELEHEFASRRLSLPSGSSGPALHPETRRQEMVKRLNRALIEDLDKGPLK